MDNTDKTVIAVNEQPSTNELLEIVNTRLKSLKDSVNHKPVTTGQFKWGPNQINAIDIFSCTEIDLLISIVAYIGLKQDSYNSAAEHMGLKTYPPFVWLGYGFEDWVGDIKSRIKFLSSHSLRKELKETKKELESLLTRDDKLNSIANKIKGFDNLFEDESPKIE